MLWLAIHTAVAVPGPHYPPASFTRGRAAHVDLLRVVEGGPRIYVQATFPDGSRGLFLVDTGADISVLSRETAARIGLELQKDSAPIRGLGGESRADRAILPSLTLGETNPTTVDQIELAVGVAGMASHAGAMPLDGLLGNNVWSRFLLELDYPADLMVLHPPGSKQLPTRRSDAMHFDGAHVFGTIELRTALDPETVHQITLRVDTGASELSLCGRGIGIGGTGTTGLEPILGLGASASLPLHRNLHMTRRVELDEVRMGGRRLDHIDTARWMNFDGSGTCPDGLIGLAGHDLLDGHRVWFDYKGQRLQMARSKRRRHQNNGHAVLLAQTPDDPQHAWLRARLNLGLDRLDDAIDELRIAADQPEHRARARVLLAAALRDQGEAEAAREALAALSTAELVEQGEIIAMVNGLLLRGQVEDARALATEATEQTPDADASWVALSDVAIHDGDTEGARDALRRAAEASGNPDAHLLRRARVAMAAGDRHATLAHVRKSIQLYPMGGEAIWFYALTVDSDTGRDTFREDLERAMARLHPSMVPLDFLVAAASITGDATQAAQLMDKGIQRDCEPVDGAARDNCLAWYWSLAGVQPDESLMRIERALAHGERADYLDTLAMVHLARGDVREAHRAALAAARRAPDNVYMLWQADRLRRLAGE